MKSIDEGLEVDLAVPSRGGRGAQVAKHKAASLKMQMAHALPVQGHFHLGSRNSQGSGSQNATL